MRNKKKFNPFAGYSAVSGLSVLFVLIMIVIAIIVVYAATGISPYRERGYMYSLKEDLNSASAAAKAYLAAHPKAIITSEEQLKSKGWTKSDRNIFISADMTLRKGQIVLKNDYLAQQPQYSPGTGRILFDGTIVLPIKKSDANSGN